MCESETYDFNQHKHNYAVWTAARAVQRNFTSTAIIKAAIEQTELRQYAESGSDKIDDFIDFHKKCCNQLIKSICKTVGNKATYGRAAKIVSIYLKTSLILSGNGLCAKSKFIHPPIDSILLGNIAKYNNISTLKIYKWTTLNEVEYWKLTNELKFIFGYFDWRIEKYWSPEHG